jgi:hypothetical protein
LLRFSGPFLFRFDAVQFSPSLFQLPPRITRVTLSAAHRQLR